MDEALHDKVTHAQPKSQVIIDPVSGARGIIRPRRRAHRFHWSVIPADEPLSIAAGRTEELARARSITKGRFASMPRIGSSW